MILKFIRSKVHILKAKFIRSKVHILKAKFIRSKAQAMTDDIEAVSNNFTTGMQILHS